jgi:hypothetical protein
VRQEHFCEREIALVSAALERNSTRFVDFVAADHSLPFGRIEAQIEQQLEDDAAVVFHSDCQQPVALGGMCESALRVPGTDPVCFAQRDGDRPGQRGAARQQQAGHEPPLLRATFERLAAWLRGIEALVGIEAR